MAHAGGGRIWYSHSSGGRMLTYETMKFFIGTHQARELFFRGKSEKTSWLGLDCPSCQKKMRKIMAPKWTGDFDVEVCPNCHLFWVDKDMYPNIPASDDLLVKEGDSTLAHNYVEAKTQALLSENRKQSAEELSAPDDLKSKIAGILGLPIEIHQRHDPFGLIGKLIAVGMVILYFFVTNDNPQLLFSLGFYPDDPLRNSGLNIFISPFFHANLAHLISNMYIYLVFANDVESLLGPLKFLRFIFFSIILCAFLTSLFAMSEGVSHIGFSGIISALLVFYTLSFKGSKIGFAFPYFGYKFHSKGSDRVHRHFFLQWIRLPIAWVLVWWILKDILFYFLFETQAQTQVSHSGHLAGYLTGFLLWLLMRKKVIANSEIEAQ
jgi:membrane associated rhomboid family serine protease